MSKRPERDRKKPGWHKDYIQVHSDSELGPDSGSQSGMSSTEDLTVPPVSSTDTSLPLPVPGISTSVTNNTSVVNPSTVYTQPVMSQAAQSGQGLQGQGAQGGVPYNFPPPHGFSAWVKHTPSNLRRFDGKEENIEGWFALAEKQGRNPLTNQLDDQQTIDAALTHIDYNEPSNPAIFVSQNKTIKSCTSWAEFKRIFRQGICQRQLKDEFTLISQWADRRMSPSETPSEYLAACDAYTEMVAHSLSKSNFSDAPNKCFSADAVAEILKHAFVLRELSIPVRQRVLAQKVNNSTSTVELQSFIVEEGGWGLK